MIAAMTRPRTSLFDYVSACTELLSAPDSRGGGGEERRVDDRFAPSDHVVVRLDVQGGIWSAGVLDISDRAACLRVDRELAERIAEDEPASVVVDLPQRGVVRLDGRLNVRTPLAAMGGRGPVATTFAYAC